MARRWKLFGIVMAIAICAGITVWWQIYKSDVFAGIRPWIEGESLSATRTDTVPPVYWEDRRTVFAANIDRTEAERIVRSKLADGGGEIILIEAGRNRRICLTYTRQISPVRFYLMQLLGVETRIFSP